MHYRLLSIVLLLLACGSSPDAKQARAIRILVERIAPAQHAYHAAQGTFAPDARSLLGSDEIDGLRLLVDGDTAGWNASVFDPALGPATCVMSVGRPALRRKLPGGLTVQVPGTIVCIDYAEWVRQGRIAEARYDSLGIRI